jgi:hypothetical protein
MKMEIFSLVFIYCLLLNGILTKKCPFGFGEDTDSQEFLQEKSSPRVL